MRKKGIIILPLVLLLGTRVSAAERLLIPGGEPVGMLLETDGAMVDSLAGYESASGKVCPAEKAGIQEGDLIIDYGGEEIHGCESLSSAIGEKGEGKYEITVIRDGEKEKLSVTSKKDKEGKTRIGVNVRENQNGLGTVTYFDPKTGNFGALGHGIQTGRRGGIPLKNGSVYKINLTKIDRGIPGKAGELQGDLIGEKIGEVLSNTPKGVFGVLDKESFSEKAIPIAGKSELHTGSAQIISAVSGEKKSYQVEIMSVDPEESVRGMRIRVTDRELIGLTGGIVRGMSGSPIIQDGKLAGAVTHVLLGDPVLGYGIAIDDMLSAGEKSIDRAA